MLPFIFDIGKIAGRQKHFIPDFVAGLLLLVSCDLIAFPKGVKSYFCTGLFAILIHPITFYCSPFFLNMSIRFP